MNYTDKLHRLQERRNPGMIFDSSYENFAERLQKSSSFTEREKAIEYALDSMKQLPKRSTEISYEEGERVKGHLKEELKQYGFSPDFRYQGSVTCNTHIKYHSDIDLLVIIDKFVTLENPARVINPYQGNVIDDLTDLRTSCIKILKENYTVADVEANSKSIKISDGSLRRNIDVVPSNWYKSEMYYQLQDDDFKGVQIFDNKTKQRQANFPFWNITLVEEKDKKAYGKYRPLVRLAKTLKEDSDNEIKISSYDIQGIFYHMSDLDFYTSIENPLELIKTGNRYLFTLLSNPTYFRDLYVPDKTRKISEKVKIDDIWALQKEFAELESEISY